MSEKNKVQPLYEASPPPLPESNEIPDGEFHWPSFIWMLIMMIVILMAANGLISFWPKG